MGKYTFVVASYRIEESKASTREKAIATVFARLVSGEAIVPADEVDRAELAKLTGKDKTGGL